MLRNILKVPFNYLGRNLNLPLTLPMSIAFAVTNKCNSHCKTCNIWKDTAQIDELNLIEINLLFRSLGRSFEWITLTGGEPFLREDLVDICQIIYQHCQPAVINIPTNGSIPDTIIDCVKKILKYCLKIKLTINLSVDGVGEEHDNIRGFPGNFNNIVMTYQGLKNLKHPRLRLGFYTVISEYNIDDLKNILSFVKKLAPDAHFFEIAQIRDEYKNQAQINIVPPEEYYINFLRTSLSFKKNNKKALLGRAAYSLRRNYYLLTEEILSLGGNVIPCFAGFASAYIFPDGKVWACSTRNRLMGDLKVYKFDFNKLWWSKNARVARRNIRQERCFCLQVNTNYLNLIHSPLYLRKCIFDYLF